MGTTDPRVDAYIEKSAAFARPILSHLRELVHAGCPEVEETMKWSCPHFIYHGILCSMASFKAHCAFGFWKASLMTSLKSARDDGKERQAMGQYGRITSLDDLPSDKVLLRQIKEAARLNAEGVKIPKPTAKEKKAVNVPAYFSTALKHNPQALEAFENLSPSHKREYLEWIAEAKTEPTRERRIATTLQWLSEGKSRNWKYERK